MTKKKTPVRKAGGNQKEIARIAELAMQSGM